MTKLTNDEKDTRLLRSAATEKRDTFQPWRGEYARAARLCRQGLLREAGICMTPPYKLYVLTDAGRAALQASK
jgi:hypothetical protein